MLDFILIGAGFAFAAAVQPGPLQAYLLSRVTAVGWQRTLPASLAPMLSDGPIAVLALVVLGRLSEPMQHGLRTAGGVVLLVLASKAVQDWRSRSSRDSEGEGVQSLAGAVLVNLINPNPYLGWTLVLGPTAVSAWREAPVNAVALVVAFYATMALTLAALILLFGTTRFLGPRTRRVLALLSGVILAVIGVYQLVVGVSGLVAG